MKLPVIALVSIFCSLSTAIPVNESDYSNLNSTIERKTAHNKAIDSGATCLWCAGIFQIPDSYDDAKILAFLGCDSVEKQFYKDTCYSLVNLILGVRTFPILKTGIEWAKTPYCFFICPNTTRGRKLVETESQ